MKKLALLIGVSEYYQLELDPLPIALKNVEAMQRILLDSKICGFTKVDVLKNPNNLEMEEAVDDLFTSCNSEDLVLFYFAGSLIKDQKGNLYLATSYTCKDKYGVVGRDTALGASVLQSKTASSRSKQKIIVLDCCFIDASSTRLMDGEIGIQRKFEGQDRAIFVSSTRSSFQHDDFELSAYTHYFIEGIETGAASLKQGYISTNDLRKYIKTRIEQSFTHMTLQFYPTREDYDIYLVVPQKNRLGSQYIRLQGFLEDKKWEEADQETTKLILEIIGQPQYSLVQARSIMGLDCLVLCQINDLWLRFSKDRFGFSVQQQIWHNLGGRTDRFSPITFNAFGVRVGWRTDDDWSEYENFIFTSDAPNGHFPSLRLSGAEQDPSWWGEWERMFKGVLARVESCLSP